MRTTLSRRTTAGDWRVSLAEHQQRRRQRNLRKKAAATIAQPWPAEQVGPGGTDVAGQLMADLAQQTAATAQAIVHRALAEAEAGWRPLLQEARLERDQARLERDALAGELVEQRRKHAQFVAMAASTDRANAETIAGLRAWALELEHKLGLPRSKETPDA